MLSIYFQRDSINVFPGNSKFREITIDTLRQTLEKYETNAISEPQWRVYTLDKKVENKIDTLKLLIDDYYYCEQFIIRNDFGYWKNTLDNNELQTISNDIDSLKHCDNFIVLFAKKINKLWVTEYAIYFCSGMSLGQYHSDAYKFYYQNWMFTEKYQDFNKAILNGYFIVQKYNFSTSCSYEKLCSLLPLSAKDLISVGLFPFGFKNMGISEIFFLKNVNLVFPLGEILKKFIENCEYSLAYIENQYLDTKNDLINIKLMFHSKWIRGAYYYEEFDINILLEDISIIVKHNERGFSHR